MDRKNMTEKENERRKREQFSFFYSDTRKIAEVFPAIERIELSYINRYISFQGEKIEENSRSFTPQDQDVFIIPCLNPTCSTIGFNVKNDIYNMVREHRTELNKERDCEGQEAPNHPTQRCGGSLKYTIRIFYKSLVSTKKLTY